MSGSGEPLIESLALDIQPALDALEPLATALTDLATEFASAIGDAIGAISAPVPTDQIIDAPAITSTLDSAIGDVSAPPIPIDGDTTGLDSGIADALDQPRPPVDVEGDTSALTDQIDTATSGATAVVPVSADTTDAQTSIDSLAAAPIEIPVTADTTDAQDSIDQLGQSATDATGSSGGSGGAGGSGISGLAGAVLGVKAATGAAQGDVSGLQGAVASLGGSTATVVAGGAAFTGFLAETVNLAAQAQAQQNRFNEVFGASADIVSHIDVGGLNISLQQLGEQSGTLTTKLESSASRIGQLGETSGASAPLVDKTTDSVLALAAATSVTNPALGDTADVADKLTRLLATGGQRLAQYGISLSSGQIAAEGLKLGLADTTAQLTPFDKLVAGSTLAVQEMGDTLGTKFTSGAQNAEVELRALKTTVEETLVAIGGPLLQPAIAGLSSLLPVIKDIGVAIGDVGQIAGPALDLVAKGLGALAAPLQLVDDGLGGLARLPEPIRVGLVALGAAAVIAGVGATSLTVASVALGAALTFATGPIGIAIEAIAAIGVAFDLAKDKAQTASPALVAFGSALQQTQTAATGYADALGAANAPLTTYLQTQLAAGKAGQTGLDGLNQLGLSIDTVAEKLTEGDPAFEKWNSSLDEFDAKGNLLSPAIGAFQDALDNARVTLDENAQTTLGLAVASGTLTQKQLDAADAQHQYIAGFDGSGKSVADNIAVLRQLEPIIEDNAAKTAASTFANFENSSSYTDLAKSVSLGAISLSDAKTIAAEYNITIAQATQAITDAEAAQDSFTAKNVIGTQAYKDLVASVANGTVTLPDAEARFQALGFSIDGAKSAASSLQSTLSSAISSIVGELPTASDAAKQWQSDVSAAFKQASDDASKHTGNITADLATLAADSDPAQFAQNLDQQVDDTIKFQSNLEALVAQGFGQLAGFLAQQKPDVAGPLAAALAGAPAKAALDQAALQASQSTTDAYQAWITSHAPQLGLDAGTKIADGLTIGEGALSTAGQQLGQAVTNAYDPQLVSPTTGAIQKVVGAVDADGSIQTSVIRLSARTVGAWSPDFETGIQTSIGNVVGTVNKDGSIHTSVVNLSPKVAAGFKPDVAGAATTQLGAAATTISTFDKLTLSMGTAGHSAGVAFDSGIAEGITDGQDKTFVGTVDSLAANVEAELKKAWGIKSPSTVAAAIGTQFTDGLAQGVAAGGPEVAQAGTDAADSLLASLEAELAAGLAASSAQTAAQTALSSLISSAVGQLPSVGNDITTFEQRVTAATTAQSKALADYHKDAATYREDQQNLHDVAAETEVALTKLNAAQTKLATDTADHAPKLTITEDSLGVRQAQSAFDSLNNKLTAATANVVKAESAYKTAAEVLNDANVALNRATDPTAFISNLNANTAAAKRFETDIETIANEGLTGLAKALAQSGVDTAGKLAEALASNPAKAKAAEAAIDQSTAFATAYQNELDKLFGVGSTATSVAQAAGGALGVSLTNGLQTAVSAGTKQTLASLGDALGGTVPQLSVGGVVPSPITAASKGAPVVASPVLSGASQTTFQLDLTVVMPDGSRVKAAATVPVPTPVQRASASLVQQVVAEVHAN